MCLDLDQMNRACKATEWI